MKTSCLLYLLPPKLLRAQRSSQPLEAKGPMRGSPPLPNRGQRGGGGRSQERRGFGELSLGDLRGRQASETEVDRQGAGRMMGKAAGRVNPDSSSAAPCWGLESWLGGELCGAPDLMEVGKFDELLDGEGVEGELPSWPSLKQDRKDRAEATVVIAYVFFF